MIISRICTILIIFASTQTFAEKQNLYEPSLKKEIAAQVSTIESGYFEELTHRALGFAIDHAANVLEKHGEVHFAQKIRDDWNDYASHVSNSDFLDIGDYEPLSQWLATIYKKLESVVGQEVLKKSYLSDIYVFNYGTPVVFQPSGDSRNEDTWDKDEYRLHFIPFSGAVAYWALRGTCQFVLKEPGFICKQAAKGFRVAMVKYIAPKVSDKVYETRISQ